MQKKRKAFVHIGMPKTGTTAIQHTMSSFRSALRSIGLIYPGNEVDHVLLIPAFHQQGLEHFYFKILGETPDIFMPRVANILNEISDIAKSADGNLLLSSEYLYSLNADALRRMDEFFANQGLEMIVICTLRHPVDSATSHTQQDVKQGHDRLVNMYKKPRWLSSKDTLQPVLEAIGKDRIIVFDVASTQDFGLERFLLQSIDHGQAANLINPIRSNESLSMAAVYLCDAHNELSVHYPEIRHDRGYIFSIGGEKFRLPEAVENMVRAECADELAWVEENFGISLKERIHSRDRANDVLSFSAAMDIVREIFRLRLGE